MIRFSAECYIEKANGDISVDDVCVIGDSPNTQDELDFHYSGMEEIILEEMNKRNLPDGHYHGYFIGIIEYEHSYNWEYGNDDIDQFVSITDFYFHSFKAEETL